MTTTTRTDRALVGLLDAVRAIPDPIQRYRAARALETAVPAGLKAIARDVVAQLHHDGWGTVAIARELGVSHQAVSQLLPRKP